MDVLGTECSHRVRVHIRTVTRPFILEMDAVRNAQKAYGQYGICIEVVTASRVTLEAAKRTELRVLDGVCRWNQVSDEQRQLYSVESAGVPSREILVYFVSQIKESGGNSLNGCGGHEVARPAIAVASTGSAWTMAHELGHVLLGSGFVPVHSTAKDNLMFAHTALITAKPPKLTPEQVATMKRSHLCTAC